MQAIGTRGISLVIVALCLTSRPAQAQHDRPTPVDKSQGRIVFTVGEWSSKLGEPPGFVLQASTERPYGCLLPLDATVTREQRTITLKDWRIPPVEVCPATLGPATGSFPLDLDLGSYGLIIEHLDVADRYDLSVTKDAIRVTPKATPRVSMPGDTLVWRYVPQSFVVECGTTETNTWVCADLFRMLATLPGLVEFNIPDTGRNPFYPRNRDRGYWHNEGARYYRYASLADYERTKPAIRRFYDEVVGNKLGYGIGVRSWTAESWAAYSDGKPGT